MRDLLLSGYIPRDSKIEPLTGGRTNHVWRIISSESDQVLKLYRLGAKNPLFPNEPESEISCLTALSGLGLAPRFIESGINSDGRWLLYEHVAGPVWSREVAQVAQLLARVHHIQAPLCSRLGANGSTDIFNQTCAILDLCQSKRRDRILTLTPTQYVPPTARLRLIHADPVPGNIVLNSHRAMLIDWQCPAFGDPAEDLAVFLSPAMQMLYRGFVLTKSEKQTFLAAYPDRAVVDRYQDLESWFHWRMAAYCLWQTEQGNKDYAAGLELELSQITIR